MAIIDQHSLGPSPQILCKKCLTNIQGILDFVQTLHIFKFKPALGQVNLRNRLNF